MADLKTIEGNYLEFNDPPSLVWIRVSDAVSLIFRDNPKLHDVGGIVESIKKHAFQELPKYDFGMGAIKAGNGRVEALAMMEQDGRYELPRGLAKEKETGAWVMPLLVGVDARSEVEAKAYLIDSNNLTMAGGDGFTPFDIARMYDPDAYLAMLAETAESRLPVSVDLEDFEVLATWLTVPNFQPVPESEQPRLDQKKPVECPECGASFVPKG